MKDAIVVKNICKHYKDFSLDHVSFRVPQGSIVGFVGENGAGKSTSIRAILDLITLDGGSVEVLGLDQEERKDPAWREQIGVVFDVGHLPELMTAAEIDRIMAGIYKQWDSQKYFGYLKQFKLSRDKKYKEFSRGMKMKLSLAVAMSHGAKLLVLDEHTGGLDPIVRDEILDIFLDYIQEEDHSILISSHIISDLEKVADYIVFIHEGQVCLQEETGKLLEQYGIVRTTSEQADQLMADPCMANQVVGRRDSRFHCEIMVRDRDEICNRYPDLVVDSAGIEEIMLYTIKGARS